MKNTKKLGLSLNKKVISSLEARQIVGGVLASDLDCITKEERCQTTGDITNQGCTPTEPKKKL